MNSTNREESSNDENIMVILRNFANALMENFS